MMDRLRIFLMVIAIMFALLPTVRAADIDEDLELIDMTYNSSRYFELDSAIERVFMSSSKIAKVKQPGPSMNEFVVTSFEKEGAATLFVWTVDGVKHGYLINVVKDEIGQAAAIEAAIGLPDVHVKKVDGRVLLTGTVKNQYERNYAIQIARLYTGSGSNTSLSFGSNVNPALSTQSSEDDHSTSILTQMDRVEDDGNVIDLLQMLNPIKIRLEAQVVEINSDKAKDLGIQYGANGEGGVFSIGENNDRTVETEVYRYWDDENNRWATYTLETGSDVANFIKRPLRWMEHRFGPINATIHALVSDGKARILSRPSLTTLSGEQATIQIGGRIPYSISNINGTTVQFENYGIILQFKPIVDGQNRIVSTVHTEVSNMTGQAVNGQPIISTRRADAVINLQSGSTMIVGGLMDSSESKAVSKIPLLGDIPIIGEFFKYNSKRRDKRELIILVTPYLIDDEQSSQTRMSDSMKDYYNQGRLEQTDLNNVNLNDPPEEGQ